MSSARAWTTTTAATALLLMALAPPFVAAQLGKYALPGADYTPCHLRNGEQKSYCPPNTTCVRSMVATGMYTPGLDTNDTRFAEYTAPGCCANASDTACLSPATNAYAPGCCPNGSACCFDVSQEQMPLIGCARDVRQCCGASICAEGYSCCAAGSYRYCCPGLEACAPVYNASARTGTSGLIVDFMPNAYRAADELNDGLPRARRYTECARVDNGTRTAWAEGEAYACGTNGSWCLNGTYTESGEADVCYAPSGRPVNATNATDYERFGAYCCPAGRTPCERVAPHRENGRLFACADEDAGETCCGNQVCGATSRCCALPSPPTWDTAAEENRRFTAVLRNGTQMHHSNTRCCPRGTYCCAMLFPSANGDGTRDSIFTYCGRNENCTSMATASESVQPLPARNGAYLPDYVESQGWFVGSAQRTYFAQQPANSCACLRSGCKTACKDQLQFDFDVTQDCT